MHALGDLADAEVTVRLREALPRPAKLGVTGEDAVEIALRTALLATGRPGIVAFEDAYHGTGLLALAATGFERFRAPFAAWLPGPVHRRAYGEDPGALPGDAGCVIVEPVQGRAGSRVPPDGFLETLRRRCDAAGALLVVDSIFAGLGRVGEMWPGEQVADVLCVGKALGGGLPLSAALFYREGLEEAWRLGPEDVYTHTHVGNPLACAAGLVVLDEVPKLLDRVREAGERFEQAGWHGRGLLRAREGDADEALARGVLVVPDGPDGSLIQATPPLDDHRRRARRGVREAPLDMARTAPSRCQAPRRGCAGGHVPGAGVARRQRPINGATDTSVPGTETCPFGLGAARVEEERRRDAAVVAAARGAARVLLERLDAQAGAHERAHDLADSPQPVRVRGIAEVVVSPAEKVVDAVPTGWSSKTSSSPCSRSAAGMPVAQPARSSRRPSTPSPE